MVQYGNKPEHEEKKVMRDSDKFVFILSIVVSLAFWLLIKLSDNYSENFDVAVRYQNIPVDKQLTSLIDSSFTLTLNTSGYNILETIIKKRPGHLVIDLNKCNPEKVSGNIYQIKKSDLENFIASRWDLMENEITVNKEKLRFILEKSNKKTVNIKVVTNLTFYGQFGLYGLQVKPEKVTVYGPASILDTLQSIYTNQIEEKNLNRDKTVETGLLNPSPALLRIVPPKAEVTLDIEKYTESVVETAIDLSDIPLNIRTFPSKVKVRFHIALKDYNLINNNSFKVKPEIKGIDLNKVDRISLKIARKPAFVSGIRIEPPEVEFLIIK